MTYTLEKVRHHNEHTYSYTTPTNELIFTSSYYCKETIYNMKIVECCEYNQQLEIINYRQKLKYICIIRQIGKLLK